MNKGKESLASFFCTSLAYESIQEMPEFKCLKFFYIQTKSNTYIVKMMSYRTWICPDCNARVSEDVYPCPKCADRYKEPHPVMEQLPKNACPVCTSIYQESASFCQVCGQLFRVPSEEKKEVVSCKKCKQENDIVNTVCVYCDEDLFQTQKKHCEICAGQIKAQLYDAHYTSCLLSHEVVLEEENKYKAELKRLEEQEKKSMEECIYCRVKFLPQAMEGHLIECKKQALKNLQFDPSTRMTSLQMNAMQYMILKSQKEHNEIKPTLQARIKKMGYTLQDLNNLQFYVENYAPIIIHIHISKHMNFFVKDTHYRSQFQTNKSSGSLSRQSRTTWEDRMFDKKYAKATDFQRVKYGVINFTNDPKGVGACVGYGQSYFLLKEHVRQRCTFTDMDSSNASSSIATFKYCFKILNKLTDNQLKAAFDASKAKEVASSCTTTYKEMQIHGPIEFAKDIERIYVNRNELKTDKKLLDLVYEFNKRFGVDYDFF